MIGFNGTSYADKSDRNANPLLQDCGIGWLQQYRANAPQRVMKDITVTSRDDSNQVIAKGDYGNYDSLVYDAVNSLMDEWYKDSPNLVVITGRNLTVSRSFPIINAVSTNNPNSEALAGQLIASRKTIGNLPSFIAPFFLMAACLSLRGKTCRFTGRKVRTVAVSWKSRNITASLPTVRQMMPTLLKITASAV